MPKQRWEEIPSNRQLTDRLHAIYARGLSGRRARSALMAEIKRVSGESAVPHMNTVLRAQEQVLNERRAAQRTARSARQATRQATQQNLRAAQAIGPIPEPHPERLEYQRQGLGTANIGGHRVDVDFIDPRTGQRRQITITNLPLVYGHQGRALLTQIIAAIDPTIADESDREYRSALLVALRAAVQAQVIW